jgi:predicted amidophosphoribosyltransferase
VAARLLEHVSRASGRLADGLIAVLLGPSCATCDRPLERPSAQVVCDACWQGIGRLTPPLCERCGDALASWRTASVAAGLCARCRRRQTWWLDRQVAAGRYDGRLRDIVHAWKYEQRRSLVDPLSALVREAARDLRASSDAVVPVPLHRSRRRERGFNQALDLAQRLELPVLPALRRVRPTAPQFELTAAGRRRNVHGAFTLAPLPIGAALATVRTGQRRSVALSRAARFRLMRDLIDGRRLLLVDDVCTTGATLAACARVLKEAGAATVAAVTAARAVRAPRRL